MKIKQFHEYSELDDPVVVQPTAFGGEQKLTHLYLAQLATERYKSKLRWNTDERGWHCFDNESGMWQRIGTEQIIALLIVTLSEMRSIEAEKIKISGSTRGSVIKEIERAENSGFPLGSMFGIAPTIRHGFDVLQRILFEWHCWFNLSHSLSLDLSFRCGINAIEKHCS